jgi:hypothetical protein
VRLPLEADRFIADLQTEMREALLTLDAGMPANQLVRIGRKRKKDGWITVTPFDPQPEPANLIALKAEIVATWPMTSLLDMLKETDLRLNFTDVLKSSTAYETLDRLVLRPRLLLGLTDDYAGSWRQSQPMRQGRYRHVTDFDCRRARSAIRRRRLLWSSPRVLRRRWLWRHLGPSGHHPHPSLRFRRIGRPIPPLTDDWAQPTPDPRSA